VAEIILTILCDNTAAMKEGIRAEHGFSVLIERGDTRILFDTGQSDVFWHNAGVMGKDLAAVDSVVLSHGHYDHTGGLLSLARFNGSPLVIGHKDVFAPRFKKQVNGSLKYIGCPCTQAHLESRGLKFKFVPSHFEVAPDVFYVSEVPRENDFEKGDPLLVVRDDRGKAVPDPFMDDAALYLRTPEGLVVVLGCSHRGVINILKRILTLEGGVPIFTIIGGTHLSRVGAEQTRKTIGALREINPRAIGVSHCTGLEVADEMKKVFGDRFFRATAGTVITINEEGGVAIQ
jgi:7,8-dihydropterin-6-yl-methyl-4-(beta-D-ribofuranosyl)aminobenzene 5'-phosphate synthase